MDFGSAESRLASIIEVLSARGNTFITGALFNADRFYVTQQQVLSTVYDNALKVHFLPSSLRFVIKYADHAASEYNVKMKRYIRGLYSPSGEEPSGEEPDDFDYTLDTLEFETTKEKGIQCLLNIPFQAIDASVYDVRELADTIAVLNEYHTSSCIAQIMCKALNLQDIRARVRERV